jgi:3-isopropylmalate dehydrogenase
MFEYAFNLTEEAGLIREAVTASMQAGIVTEDIAEKGTAHTTSAVGDWIAGYISGK